MNTDIHTLDFPTFTIESTTLIFIDVNAAMIKQFGYTKEEFLTMKLFSLRPQAE